VRELHVEDSDKRGAGTTCSALLIRRGRGFLAHVGDSRIYLKRQGALHRLTVDHTLIEHAIEQGISREIAEANYPSNALVRAIGPHPNLVVDTLVFDVLPNDTYLLCSDGLHEYFEESGDELSELLAGNPGTIAEKLVQLALERGGGDNITALVLRSHPELTDTLRETQLREDLTALWHMPLFNDMSYQELLEIVDAVETVSFEADETVVSEGEESDHLYVVSSGNVRVERGKETIAELGPGHHFGEMAVLTNRPRSATVRATESTRLLALSRDAITALFSRRPAIGMKFLWTLAQVQSIRLDEALVWRELSKTKPKSQRSILEELERTVRMENPNLVKQKLKPGRETQRLFPPPLSRHR
jgi:CRP-like cAMP-binding protein